MASLEMPTLNSETYQKLDVNGSNHMKKYKKNNRKLINFDKRC